MKKMQVAENPAIKNRSSLSPLVIIVALMVSSYLTANVMAVKIISVFGIFTADAGTLTFPIAFVLGDVLTEIWGFKIARKVIFLTFACNIFMVIFTSIGTVLPSPDYLGNASDAYGIIFSYVPRIVAASLIAFLAGELSNAFLMEKIKTLTSGRWLWLRTIGSSLVGYVFDTLLFCMIAFAGLVSMKDLFVMIISQYLIKLFIEAICGTPLAYALVAILRRKVFDYEKIQQD